MKYIIIMALIVFAGTVYGATIEPTPRDSYVECLVKTSDNLFTKTPQNEWSDSMWDEHKAGNARSGYIVVCHDEGWKWGIQEKDPAKFAIVKFLKSEYNESWLIEQVDKEGNTLLQRRYRLPIDSFMNTSELTQLYQIDYNEKVDWSIAKTVSDVESKIVETDIDLMPPVWKSHGSSGSFTVCSGGVPSGCDYSGTITWESGEDSDLTGTGPCIATITDGFTEASAVNFLYINGWTTTEEDYILVQTNSEARHPGYWDNTKYILASAYQFGAALKVTENYVTIDGLQINRNYSGGSAYVVGGTSGVNGVNLTFSNNIARNAYGNGVAINLDQADGTLGAYFIVYNNIAYDVADGIYANYASADKRMYIYSNTVLNTTGDAIEFVDQPGDVELYLKNNLCFNNADDYQLTAFTVRNYTNNMGEDADGGSQDNYVQTSQAGTDIFVNYDNRDYHIKTGSDAEDAGADLSNDQVYSFDKDIDNETRSGTWDIGADEIVSGADTTAPLITLVNPSDINTSVTTRNWTYVNISSDEEISTCTLNFADSLYPMTVTTPSAYYNHSNIANANYTYNVSCNDTSNNLGNSSQAWVNIDFTAPVGDTCDCSSIQAGTAIDCTENCDVDSCDAIGQALTFSGSGTVIINADIYNHGDVEIINSCHAVCLGGCFKTD